MQNRTVSLHSRFLERQVELTFLLPSHYDESNEAFRLLILNDGQDFERLQLAERVEYLYRQQEISDLIIVGIHANELRLWEYGTAHQPDYKGRGSKAEAHNQFILQELLPYLNERFRLRDHAESRAIAGFSLGGLSALDTAWNHSGVFSKVGVFSGSLWWRSRAYEEGYDDENDRIMHVQIRQSTHKPALKFWLQAGTDDERDDRNNNGIIDAIDDTLDLMKELEAKGYSAETDFTYVEVPGGQHNPETWGAVMPRFLTWAFGKRS